MSYLFPCIGIYIYIGTYRCIYISIYIYEYIYIYIVYTDTCIYIYISISMHVCNLNLHTHTCRFPEIGVPPVIIHILMGFSLTKTIQLLGWPRWKSPWALHRSKGMHIAVAPPSASRRTSIRSWRSPGSKSTSLGRHPGLIETGKPTKSYWKCSMDGWFTYQSGDFPKSFVCLPQGRSQLTCKKLWNITMFFIGKSTWHGNVQWLCEFTMNRPGSEHRYKNHSANVVPGKF